MVVLSSCDVSNKTAGHSNESTHRLCKDMRQYKKEEKAKKKEAWNWPLCWYKVVWGPSCMDRIITMFKFDHPIDNRSMIWVIMTSLVIITIPNWPLYYSLLCLTTFKLTLPSLRGKLSWQAAGDDAEDVEEVQDDEDHQPEDKTGTAHMKAR